MSLNCRGHRHDQGPLFRPAADPADPPLPANDSLVRQGAVEGSNVTAVTEITNLINISRAYERITQIMNAASDLSLQAVNTLGKVV